MQWLINIYRSKFNVLRQHAFYVSISWQYKLITNSQDFPGALSL